MTILSDGEIAEELASKRLIVEPMPELTEQLQPASLDLRLGTKFSWFPNDGPIRIDTKDGVPPGAMKTTEAPYLDLWPSQFVLAHTVERVTIPDDLVGVVDGRSSLGRLGVMVHITAGYIDPGFSGQITLEMHNVGTAGIRLHAGNRVCQIRFHRMARASAQPYRGKYQGDMGAVSSRIEKDEGADA